jgi:hypothetical protein
MALRPTQEDEDQWWRELQLAAPASAGDLCEHSSDGESAANFGLFFNGAVLNVRNHPARLIDFVLITNEMTGIT